jgi:hypothetical protein
MLLGRLSASRWRHNLQHYLSHLQLLADSVRPAAAVAPFNAQPLCAVAWVGADRYGEPPAHSHEEALQSIRRAADTVKSDVLTALEQMRLRREQGAVLSPGPAPAGADGRSPPPLPPPPFMTCELYAAHALVVMLWDVVMFGVRLAPDVGFAPNTYVEEPYYEEAIPMYDPRELPISRGNLFKKSMCCIKACVRAVCAVPCARSSPRLSSCCNAVCCRQRGFPEQVAEACVSAGWSHLVLLPL